MSNVQILAGLDAGHVNTKAVVMSGQEILGYCTVATEFNPARVAQEAINEALAKAGISRGEIAGLATTGVFRDMIESPALNVMGSVPDYVADAKGALFLNKDSRTVIDIGGNIHKAVRYDRNGNLLDVVQNDKCADGVGIFYSAVARALGVSEQRISELAPNSTRDVSVAIQCVLSAESEIIDLMCQGVGIADLANAILKFIVDRVATMCMSLSLAKEIVVAGGLSRSEALVLRLRSSIGQDVSVLDLPEYVGAIGAVMSCGGRK